MKVHPNLRVVYEDQHKLNELLRDKVDDIIRNFKSASWHYESCLKKIESFALKVESGVVRDPAALEDFFGGVLVVPNLYQLRRAEAAVLEHFSLIERRPASSSIAEKEPAVFAFDDLRLHLQLPDDESLPATPVMNIRFELQIRTFLQHAWAVATHDTVYKSDSVSWPRERVAHQIKAMLEHAELSIDNLEALTQSSALSPRFAFYDRVNGLVNVLQVQWLRGGLPEDMKRLASTILQAADALVGKSRVDFQGLFERGAARYGGAHNSDWSPYRTTLEYLADEFASSVAAQLKVTNQRMLVYEGILSKLGLQEGDLSSAITLLKEAQI